MSNPLSDPRVTGTISAIAFITFALPFAPQLVQWAAFVVFILAGLLLLGAMKKRHEELRPMFPEEGDSDEVIARKTLELFNRGRH